MVKDPKNGPMLPFPPLKRLTKTSDKRNTRKQYRYPKPLTPAPAPPKKCQTCKSTKVIDTYTPIPIRKNASKNTRKHRKTVIPRRYASNADLYIFDNNVLKVQNTHWPKDSDRTNITANL